MSTKNKTSIEIELKKLNSNFNTFNKIMSSFLVIATTESTFKNKTNKEIKEKGFTNWEGITSKMYKPVSHLDDCNLKHYNLQLSLYAYIIKKHNVFR